MINHCCICDDNKNHVTALKALLIRCANVFSEMRYVDKYHVLYGRNDSVDQIEADIRALIPEVRGIMEETK